jgi:hypothetical protein
MSAFPLGVVYVPTHPILPYLAPKIARYNKSYLNFCKAVSEQIVVFWIVTPIVGGYQCFKGTCCIHLQNQSDWGEDGLLNTEQARI